MIAYRIERIGESTRSLGASNPTHTTHPMLLDLLISDCLNF